MKIIRCIKGGSCDGELAQDQAIRELADKQANAIANQKANIQTLIGLIEEQQSKIQAAQIAYSTTKGASDLGLSALEAVAAVLHGAPKITTAVGILGASVATEINVTGPMDIALAIAKRVAEGTLDLTKFNIDMENQLREVAQKLQEYKNRLAELTDQDTIQKASIKQALAELMGKKLAEALQESNIGSSAKVTL